MFIFYLIKIKFLREFLIKKHYAKKMNKLIKEGLELLAKKEEEKHFFL